MSECTQYVSPRFNDDIVVKEMQSLITKRKATMLLLLSAFDLLMNSYNLTNSSPYLGLDLLENLKKLHRDCAFVKTLHTDLTDDEMLCLDDVQAWACRRISALDGSFPNDIQKYV